MDISIDTASVAVPTPMPRKPRFRFLKRLFYTLVILGVLLVLVLGYLGFVPGLSSLFGSDKPRDLGVQATAGDEQSIQMKTEISLTALPASAVDAASLKISGSKSVDTTFTDKELTALMAQHAKLWKYYPITSAQVRFNQDGTAELSGILQVDRIYGYVAATGIDPEDVKDVLDKAKIITSSPAIYLKGKASVENGVIHTDLQKLEIGRLPLPTSLFAGDESDIRDFAQDRLNSSHVNISHASVSEGKVDFKGTIPTNIGFSK